MALNAKVAFLLLGLLLGGVAGYLTRPAATELKIGGASIELQDNKTTAGSSDSVTTGQSQHILIYTLAGGVIGLLVGFAVGGRR